MTPDQANTVAAPARVRTKADSIQIDIFRRMTPEQRLDSALCWTRSTLEMARAGIRADHPEWPPVEIERELVRRLNPHDGRGVASGETIMVDPVGVGEALRRLEAIGLPYCLSGSHASSAWGRPRATFDVDVVIELHARDVDRLVQTFPAPE